MAQYAEAGLLASKFVLIDVLWQIDCNFCVEISPILNVWNGSYLK